MYTKEQIETALKEFERLGSAQATITLLGYPSISTLYRWYERKDTRGRFSCVMEFQINHLATAAVVAACVYWPALSPFLYSLLAKSSAAAVGAMSILAPIVRYAYT